MLGALDSCCGSGRPLLVLGRLGLLAQGIQPPVETLCLELDVPRYAAFLLHDAETSHSGHQRLLLLAELQNLDPTEIRIAFWYCSSSNYL